MAGKTIKARKRKTGKTKQVAMAAAGLAASALLEAVVQRAVEDPRFRRKVKALGKAIARRTKAARDRVARRVRTRRKRRPRTAAARG